MAGPLDDALDEIVGAPGPVVFDDGIEGLKPLLRLDLVDVAVLSHVLI